MKLLEWLKGEGQIQGFLRDLIFVAVVVGAISILSQVTLGVWTPMVAVESGSMYPNMKVGDIIVIQGASRTDVVTWEEGRPRVTAPSTTRETSSSTGPTARIS